MIICVVVICAMAVGCGISAKYASDDIDHDVSVGQFRFDSALAHSDSDTNGYCDHCGIVMCYHSDTTLIPAKDNTCTENGNIAYRKCNGCEAYLNEAGDTVISLADTVIPASHNFVDAVCTVCGQKLLYGGYINWINNNEFAAEADAKVTELSQPVHESLPGGLLPISRLLNLRGWVIMDGDVAGYGYSVNGGEWQDATAMGSYTQGIDDYKNAFPNITNPGDMAIAGFADANGGINLDLSAYLGQCVSVTLGAKGSLTGTEYVPLVTINGVHVKTGFAADIATIENIVTSDVKTHKDGGVIQSGYTVSDDMILNLGGWMLIDGGQSEIEWSVDGGANWNKHGFSYMAGDKDHSDSAALNAGSVGTWNTSNTVFEAALDLSNYAGKTITITLSRFQHFGERIEFAKLTVTVPGDATHDCTSDGWTVLEDGTHTGLCSVCNAYVTEAHIGAYNSNSAEHWQECTKCGIEISGTRTSHGTPTQTLCTEDKTCPTCGWVVEAAGSHDLTGGYVSNGDGTHTMSCANAGCTHTESGPCSGGTAYCNALAKCENCGGEHGTADASNHASATTNFVDNGDGTHSELYDCCNAVKSGPTAHATSLNIVGNGEYHINKCTSCSYTENVNCTGGSANCQAQATCDVCSQPYGAKNMSVHTTTSTTFRNNSDGTHTELYTCCSTPKGAAVAHTYGSFTSNGSGSHVRTCSASGCGATDTAACISDNKYETNDSQHWTNCSTCGYDMGKATHSYATFSEKNDTQHTYKCSCGATQTSNHTWNSGTQTTDPTCTATGVKTFTCKAAGCGATKTENIAALGHTGGSATCKELAVCTKCSTSYGSYAGHSYTSSKLVTAANCTTAEYRQSCCKWCESGSGDYYYNGSALGHDWTSLDKSTYKVTCSRGCSITPKFISPSTMKGAAQGYTGVVASTNVDYGTFLSTTGNKQGENIYITDAGIKRYAVFIYGFDTGYPASGTNDGLFRIQAGIDGNLNSLKTYAIQKTNNSGDVRTEILDFGVDPTTVHLFTGVHVTQLNIWGLATFDSGTEAETYQDALAKFSTGNSGKKYLDSGYAKIE